MKTIRLYKEEFDTDLIEIGRAESIWKISFPSEYKDFLLKHNGGVPYPNCPKISSQDNSELWPIQRFLSVGDIILQKLYPLSYTLHDIVTDDFQVHHVHKDQLLVFAIAERGVYLLNLHSSDYSRIYFANYSGGDGLIKVNTSSFLHFYQCLELPEWSDEEYDPEFQLTELKYAENKIFQTYLFSTPHAPELGFNRFKEVFKVLGNIQPPEHGYPTIPQKYVHDRLKLDYLLENGCSSDGLLLYARNADDIKHLLEDKGLDINKVYKGRYPLQNYLTPTSTAEVKVKYELIDQLLEMNIQMDWSIQGTKVDGTPDLPMIKKLHDLHEQYLKYEITDKIWWIKNGKPSGHVPFKRSKLIEERLGLRSQPDIHA